MSEAERIARLEEHVQALTLVLTQTLELLEECRGAVPGLTRVEKNSRLSSTYKILKLRQDLLSLSHPKTNQ